MEEVNVLLKEVIQRYKTLADLPSQNKNLKILPIEILKIDSFNWKQNTSRFATLSQHKKLFRMHISTEQQSFLTL